MSKPEGYPETPNLDLQTEAIKSGQADLLGSFLDHLEEDGLKLCRWREDQGHWNGGEYVCEMTDRKRSELLERFFGMDPQAASEERGAVYRWVQGQAEQQP